MFNYISGPVAELMPGAAVIDCGGVGFLINTSATTISRLRTGENARLFTHVYIRDDVFEIYGFATSEERRCFEMLLGVSGVGPKAAVSILSVNTPENLVMSILAENDKAISAAPGIGKKIAQRVILELKDKMAKDTQSISFPDAPVRTGASVGQNKRADAAAALSVLGYSAAEINAALKTVDVDALSLEEIIKAALKQMMN